MKSDECTEHPYETRNTQTHILNKAYLALAISLAMINL